MKPLLSLTLALAIGATATAADNTALSSLDHAAVAKTTQMNQNADGKPMSIAGHAFGKGLGMRTPGGLAVELGAGAEAFSAMVGIDDAQPGPGAAEFAVFGDGKLLWRSGALPKGEGPVKVNVKFKNLKQLVLYAVSAGAPAGVRLVDWGDAQVAGSGKPTLAPLPAGKSFDLPAPPEVTVGTFMSKVPEGYTATLFAKPPEVSYPVEVCATGSGEVFVSVDKNGSLDKAPHRGSIVRLVDTKGTGTADRVDTFVADVDSPRGLYYDGATLLCLHPPTITAYRDTDGDGKADKIEDIVTGIGYGFDKHPADHTSNGIRQAIDGWIYLAIGDFGVPNAKGTDGKVLTMRGGGVLRMRSDGSELEVYAHHTRNILDISEDPYLNGFIYDNTNDGDGWNTRFSYFVGLADMGYPSLYARFGKQLLPTLADFGGGSAVGSIYIHEPGLPGGDGDSQFVCDWGPGKIWHIPLKADGAGWEPVKREVWAQVDHVTDMDIDGNSRLYVSSWKGAVFTYAGPSVGAVIQLRPTDASGAAKFPDLKKADEAALLKHLASRSAVCRQQTQNEILRRGQKPAFKAGLAEMAKASAQPLYVRIAALFTFAQLYGAESHETLIALAKDESIQEWALRALADRKPQLAGVPAEPFLAGLKSANPRVRVQALIGLARLGKPEYAKDILPLAAVGADWHDAQLIIPHTAVRALVELGNAAPAIAAVTPGSSPELIDGALWALKWMHDEKSVAALAELLKGATPELKKKIVDTLAHLYYTEGEWNKEAWWTTRPEHKGPYYQKATWAGTAAAEAALKAAAAEGGELGAYATERIEFYGLKIEGLAVAAAPKAPQAQNDAELLAKARAASAKYEGKVIGNIPFEDVVAVASATKGDPKLGEQLFARQGCIACHTVDKGVPPKGPYLGEITKQYSRAQLVESIVKPNAVISQGFVTHTFDLKDGTHLEGFITSEGAETITIRSIIGLVTEIQTEQIAKRGELKTSMMPEGLVNNLKPEELASLLAWFETLAAAK
jgi:putative heme-binding domain-containing protein